MLGNWICHAGWLLDWFDNLAEQKQVVIFIQMCLISDTPMNIQTRNMHVHISVCFERELLEI